MPVPGLSEEGRLRAALFFFRRPAFVFEDALAVSPSFVYYLSLIV